MTPLVKAEGISRPGTRGLPPGTIHEWHSGTFQKQADGTWLPVTAGTKANPAQLELPTAPAQPQADPAEQWRTMGCKSPAFKAWFGDWEADPKGSSKVVNESGPALTQGAEVEESKVKDSTGRPIKVFHGTPAGDFDAMDPKTQKTYNVLGPGFYFSEDPGEAQSYMEKLKSEGKADPSKLVVKQLFLNIRKPFQAEYGGVRREEALAKLPKDGRAYKVFEAMPARAYPGYREMVEAFQDDFRAQLGTPGFNPRTAPDPPVMVREVLQALGYDGMQDRAQGKNEAGEQANIWVAWEPTQVKDARNSGAFDPKNPSMFKGVRPNR